MKLRKRWLILVVAVLLLAPPVILLFSETALQSVAAHITQRLPALELSGVRGRLVSGASVERVVWHTEDGTRIRIDQLQLEWSSLLALTGRAHIRNLTAAHVAVDMPAGTPGTPADDVRDRLRLPELPIRIRISQMQVSNVTVSVGGTETIALEHLAADRLTLRDARLGLRSLVSDWTWMRPQQGDLQGTLAVTDADERRVPFVIRIPDDSASLAGVILDPLGAPRLEGLLSLVGLRPARIHPDAPAMQVDGSVTLRGWLDDLQSSARLHMAFDSGRKAEVTVEAALGDELLVVTAFTLATDGLETPVRGRARYEWSGGIPQGRLNLAWDALTWPFEQPAGLTSAGGTLGATLDGGTLVFELDAQVGQRERGRVRAEGRTAWPLSLDDLRGRVDLHWENLLTDDIDSPSGHLEANGSLDGWRVQLHRVTGTLREWVFELVGDASGKGRQVEALDVTGSVGEAQVTVRGTLGDIVALDWQLDIPDLAIVSRGARGNAHATGRLRGPSSQPTIDFTLEANAADLHIKVSSEGVWRERAYTGVLLDAEVRREGHLPWQLASATALTASRDSVNLDDACMTQGDHAHRLCIVGGWTGTGGVAANLTLEGLPLDALRAWLPEGFVFDGSIGGGAEVHWRPGAHPRAALSLAIGEGAWRQDTVDGMVSLIEWNRVALDATVQAGSLTGAFRFALADGGELEATLTLPVADTDEGVRGQRPLAARFRGQFTDFDLLPALVADIGSVTGNFRADLAVAGTLDNPTFQGEFLIDQGIMTLPRVGLQLTEMEFEMEGGRELLAVRAQTRSGDGLLSVTGLFAIVDGTLRGDVRLDGEDFLVAATPEARVTVAPRIHIDINGHTVRVDGELAVPEARLEPRDFTGIVLRSEDEVLLDAPLRPGFAERWLVHSRVRMTLGDVSFDGFGLRGKITGALTAFDEPDKQTLATGELQVQDGRYAAWGQMLEIERGRLLFNGGPLSQPGLDVRAVRRVRDVTVGVNVRGPLREPVLTLFSDPPMQQAELLSWLVLGMPLAQTSGTDQQLLDRTARSASLAGGELLARELGRRLGISEIGIEHGLAPEDAALVLGHYFSPRVYVAYGIGLYESTNSLRLRFHLDRHWTIEAQTSEDASSTDLKYTIER